MSRQRRLLASQALALFLALAPAAVAAEETLAGQVPPKKLRTLLEKKAAQAEPKTPARVRWQAKLDRRIGKAPGRIINIYNTWTQEFVAVPAKKRAPTGVPQPTVDNFFRCHFTNAPTQMDPRLFGALVRAARHFGAARIDIVSAFRSPKFNLILRKKGRGVARKSQHTLGHAVDFRVRGVAIAKLHDWAKSQRLGGVGFYPSSRFIHMDVGPVRYWSGK